MSGKNRISEYLDAYDSTQAADGAWFIDYDEDLGILVCYTIREEGRILVEYEQGDLTAAQFVRAVWGERLNHFGSVMSGDIIVSTGVRVMQCIDFGVETCLRAQFNMVGQWVREFNLN